MSTIEVMPARLTGEETADLRRAIACLEAASFAQRLTDAVGRPIGAITRNAPEAARRFIARASESALRSALTLALTTIDRKRAARPAGRAHTLAAAASGAVGGAFGLAALPVELPLSTAILMRSIAEIAREEGEDLGAPNAALACVEVFALGGRGEEAAFESGYFAIRAALAQSVSESARFLASQGLGAQSAPAVIRLLSQVAARFGVIVSEKAAAQAAPILGAIGGAAVNAAFASHFQSLARGHFIVRRLERTHGADLVAFEYRRLKGEADRKAA
ncbi:EcsC family protein [Roseiarcus fermentans]|uniref:EcsC family protein n=1 Tax=Roseiarcus fermentans TaxID=1473586 RepID=A0A366FRL1_9HYPH|nr:EcsC family protein [Roseiarcus fermentans]RBP17323.1 EcsC family protein [Roseiarcus fermentans]